MYAAGGGGYGGFGGPGGDQFADEFLDMMGGKRKSKYETDSQPAHLKFTGEMKNAFHILTKAMDAKGNETLLEYGKHKETYRSGADELRRTTDFTVKELNMNLSKEVKQKLKEITDGKTPEQTKPHMKAMIDICGDYLAQHAEYSKDKGPAFKILVQKMKGKGSAPLYTRNNIFKPYNVAAKDLEDAKGLDTDGDDQELTKKIQSELEKTVAQHTPSNMKDEMKDAIDKSSKYLSYKAIHDEQRGEPFEMLIKLLQQKGDKKFSPQHKELETNHLAAHALKTAPRLDVTNPDPALAAQFKKALEEVALKDTPPEMLEQMREVIQMCSNYLSVYVRDRGKAMQNLLQHMKGKGNEELVRRLNYGMTYAKAAQEVEEAPGIVPYLPVKDIADEVQVKLTDGMKNKTPKGLEHATKALINDVAGHLSQPVALRSGSAGERYPLNYLANVKESLGDRKLYDYKNYTQTYKGAARELKAAGELTSTSQELNFAHAINEEMKEGVRTRVGPGIHFDLTGTMAAASQHLANIGSARGEALEHLVSEMDKKGNQKLARLQGYDQTYKEAASRVKRTDTLETSRVDQPAYKDVGSKLNALMRDKPPPQKLATAMPEVVDETAQFLASPIPETKGEKRKVLADLMGRKQDDVLGKDGHYKMTYDEGGKKFIDAPYDINPVSLDPEKQKEVTRGVKSVVPHDNQPLQHVLSETTREAGSHLTDVMKGRKEAMDVIHTGLKEGADKDLINTGPHRVSYADGAKMVEEAPHFQKGGAAPAISDEVEKKIGALPQSGATQLATKHMASTTKIASQYIAGGATEQSGMPVKELALPVHDDSKIAAGKAAAEGSVSAVAGTLGNPLAGGPGTSMTASPGSVTGVTGSSLAAGTKSAVAEKSGNPLTGGQGSALAGGPDSSFAQKPGIPLAGGPGSALAVGPATSPSAGPGSPSAGVPASGLGSDIGGGVEGVPSAPGSGIGGAPGSALGGQASPGVSSDGPAVPVASKGGVGSLTGGVSGPDGFPGKSGSGKIGGSASGVGVTDKDVGPDGKKKSEERGAIEGGGVAKDEGGSGGKGGGKSKSGDGEAPGHRGGHVGKSPGSRGSEKLGKDDAKGEKAKRGVDKVDVKGAKSESAEGNETSVSSEEEPLDPNACPCAVAAARIKRRHMRRQQRQETLQQNKANTLALLRKELAAKGDAPFYESIPSKLTHKQASEWLGASMRVEPSVKTSNDVTRLQAKIEDKLFELMNTKYPDPMEDAMQDVIIESARKLAENYVSKHYQKSATHAFISEMQKKGNTLLTDDGETYFYAAQRLKRSDDLYELEPCEQTSPYLQQELDNTIHGRSIPRKMVGTMKGHSKTIADYLSTRVGKPDNEITAYCTLLDEMEAQGDQDLVNNKMKLSYKEGTDYLRQLVTNEDIINKPDRDVSVQINQNLTALVNSSDALKECDRDEVKKVQTRSTNLLTSYVSSHVDKTEALKSIVEAMEQQGDAVLLRHGPVVRTFKDGAERLKYKNSSDIHNYISKSGPPDPVVLRKINVRIENIGNEALTKKPEVTKDVTTYLAKSFTEPHVSRVCKCRKSVPVQCELWCDEILRRVAKPCCVCARCGPGAAPHVACVPGAGPRAACVLCEPPCAAARPTDQCSTYALHSIHYTHSPTDRLSRALLQPPSCESWLRAADCSSSLLLGQENSTLPSTALSASTSSFDEIVSTNEMSDWNAMLVSLMWNMQAWRHWIHEQMNRAQTHNLEDSDNLPSWTDYEKRVAMEALQWRQYNIFSKQLAMKLAYRYSNKQIISPTRETNKTKEYLACQSEMIDLIAMFKKWTHWLALVLNETRDLEVPAATTTNTLNKLRWNHFYYKLQERAEDWRKYDMYFEECWKENTLNKIPGWVSGMRRGAAWVMSACGAVPCGAVPCGAVPRGGGAAWLARTTHRCQVLPAALLPSKHCCIVYADEKVFRYNKYQVLCNADVDWMPWNSGSMSSSAVPIGTKSYAGRVVYKGSHLLGPVLPPHYRCHVVLMGRPFAFNSYQLLVFNDTNKLNWTKRCS